ncbi:MAG: hypothetical protein ACYCYR_03605 [Desulfobulbaceae bacterium]
MNVSCLWKNCAGPAVLFSFFTLLLIPQPLGAVVTEYDGERVEWNFEVIEHLVGGSISTFNFTPLGCSTTYTDGGTKEMQCSYSAALSPYYGDIYRVNAIYTPASGTNHAMWTTVKPYPNHDEYDFLSPISNYVSTGDLEHSFDSIFIPMWPEDVNTAYEIVIRYYSSQRNMAFNIRFWFWGFDPKAIPNIPWLKGEPGENPYLKFCGGKPRPEKEPGGPGR